MRVYCYISLDELEDMEGDVAQMVERSLSMREVRGSIPRISNILFVFLASFCRLHFYPETESIVVYTSDMGKVVVHSRIKHKRRHAGLDS